MSVTKEQARRLEVELGYCPPPPEIPSRAPHPSERTSGSLSLVALARRAGFTTRELFARSTLSPAWKRLDPDDVLLSYVAPVADVLRVGGLVRPLPLATTVLSSAYLRTMDPGELVAFEVVWIDGGARHARSLIRSGASAKWVVEGVTAVRARLRVG